MAISVPLTDWNPQTRAVVQELDGLFAGISWGTYPGHDPTEQRAADGMVPGYKTAAGKAKGWELAKHIWANRERYNVWYVIFDAKIISQTRPEQGWIPYHPTAAAVRASRDSAYHYNHVHFSTKPQTATPYGTVWIDRLVSGVTDSDSVRLVQRALGLPQTGSYDEAAMAAGKAFQRALGDAERFCDGLLGKWQTVSLLTGKGVWATVRTDPSGEPPPPAPAVTYTVQAGDTLTRIAARLGLGWRDLANLNPGIDPDVLSVGQVITVPRTIPAPDPEPEEPKPVSHKITAAYGNILRRTDDMAGRKRWPDRKANVVQALASTDASVIMLCETDKVTASDIAAGLGQQWAYYPSGLATSKTFSPLAILWDTGVWQRKVDAFVREYSDNENRFLQRLPLTHRASGQQVVFYASHLENDGDPATDGHVARRTEARQWAGWTLDQAGIWGADLNSTTRSSANSTTREKEKPRPILRAAGWRMLTDQKGVSNRELASHHGGKSSTPKGPWIDDMGFKGVTYISGGLVRTDGTDASDHHFLRITVQLRRT